MRLLLRKLKSFAHQPPFARLWLLPVWCILGFCKALIFIVSFRRLAVHLGHPSGTCPWVSCINASQEERAREIGRVIRLAARYTPWQSNCFPQAIAARLLLGFYRVPFTLCFGLMRDATSGEMKAHAWVTAGRVYVTGGNSFLTYTVVGVFAKPRLMAP
jgi:hypothetical protein